MPVGPELVAGGHLRIGGSAAVADEVVVAEAEEHEVVVGQEAEEVPGLGGLVGVAGRGTLLELGGHGQRPGPHGRPVLHRRPHVVEDGQEVGPERLHPVPGRLAVDLDVDEAPRAGRRRRR